VTAQSQSGGGLDRWTLFRIDLSELGARSWERINWKNTAVTPAADFYVDDVRLIKFADAPPAPPQSPPPLSVSSKSTVTAAPSMMVASTATPSPGDASNSALMDGLHGILGGAAAHANDTEQQLNSYINSRGGVSGVLNQAGLTLSNAAQGAAAASSNAALGLAAGMSQMGATQPGGGIAGMTRVGAAPGYGAGYSTPLQGGAAQGGAYGGAGLGGSAGVGAGVVNAGASPITIGPNGVVSSNGVPITGTGYNGGSGAFPAASGTYGAQGAGLGIDGGLAGAATAGTVSLAVNTASPTGGAVLNGGASTNLVDPVYAAGIYGGQGGATGTTGGIPVTANPSVFYGGSYGGQGGVFLAGRSTVRVYLFPACAHPSVAASWQGCWCALCYADVNPQAFPTSTQRLLNSYALVAKSVAANDIKAAAIQAQRNAADQAVQQQTNARILSASCAHAWVAEHPCFRCH
jgi:hypothetical protein